MKKTFEDERKGGSASSGLLAAGRNFEALSLS